MAVTKQMMIEFSTLFGLSSLVNRDHPNFPHEKFQIYLVLRKQLLNSGITPTKEMFALMSVEMVGPDY
jgi:hypothetical protein